MPHVDVWSLVLLAIAPAIVVAAFAARLKGGAIKVAVLTVAATPSVAIACVTFNAWLHEDAGTRIIPVAGIALCGLGLTAFAARLGHRLSKGRGLTLLTVMGILPIVAFAFLYLRAQAASRASQFYVPTFEERLQNERLLKIRDQKRLNEAARELPALTKKLRQCAQDLSANHGRTSARADHRQGKLQLIILRQVHQESISEKIPGVDWSEYELIGKYSERPYIRMKNRQEQRLISIPLGPPPYNLWSDPWYRYPFPTLRPLIETCDAAVSSYAATYNRTTLLLNPRAKMPTAVPD